MAGFDDKELDACSILVPVDVVNTPGVLQSVTAGGVTLAEDTNPAWAAGTTYTAGQRVYLLSTHRVYESTGAAGNAGKDPSLPANRYNAAGVATFWIDEIGPTNRTAMFDGLITTPTSAASPLVITMTPGAFNGFALLGIDADSYAVTVKDAPGGNVIYSEDMPLEGSMPGDYYEYFFDRFKPLTQFIRSGIEPYGSSEITLTLRKGSGPVKLGMFAIGDLRPVGIPQRDAKVEPQDFSYIKQDAFGNGTIKRRPNSTNMSISARMDIEEANTVLDTIKGVLGVPVVVVGSEAVFFEWLLAFGPISASMSPVPYPYATVNISVKGFI